MDMIAEDCQIDAMLEISSDAWLAEAIGATTPSI
jgi:hypothetical protein